MRQLLQIKHVLPVRNSRIMPDSGPGVSQRWCEGGPHQSLKSSRKQTGLARPGSSDPAGAAGAGGTFRESAARFPSRGDTAPVASLSGGRPLGFFAWCFIRGFYHTALGEPIHNELEQKITKITRTGTGDSQPGHLPGGVMR